MAVTWESKRAAKDRVKWWSIGGKMVVIWGLSHGNFPANLAILHGFLLFFPIIFSFCFPSLLLNNALNNIHKSPINISLINISVNEVQVVSIHACLNFK